MFGRKEKIAEELEALKTNLQEVNAMIYSIETSGDADWFKAPKLILARQSSEKALARLDKLKSML